MIMNYMILLLEKKKLSDYSEGYKLVDYFKYIIKRILPVKLRHNIQGIIK